MGAAATGRARARAVAQATALALALAGMVIVITAATVLLAGCGDAAETVATSSAGPTSDLDDRLESVEEWGVEFRVAGSLPERSPVLDYSQGDAVAEMVMFSSRTTMAEPLALLSLGRTAWNGGDAPEALTRLMADPKLILKDQYASVIGRDGHVSVTSGPTATTVGPGWPGVGAEYEASVAGGSLGELGVADLGIKLVYFRRGKYLMSCTLMVAPSADLEAWRDAHELTVDSLAPTP